MFRHRSKARVSTCFRRTLSLHRRFVSATTLRSSGHRWRTSPTTDRPETPIPEPGRHGGGPSRHCVFTVKDEGSNTPGFTLPHTHTPDPGSGHVPSNTMIAGGHRGPDCHVKRQDEVTEYRAQVKGLVATRGPPNRPDHRARVVPETGFNRERRIHGDGK